jgi:hypothetical protein
VPDEPLVGGGTRGDELGRHLGAVVGQQRRTAVLEIGATAPVGDAVHVGERHRDAVLMAVHRGAGVGEHGAGEGVERVQVGARGVDVGHDRAALVASEQRAGDTELGRDVVVVAMPGQRRVDHLGDRGRHVLTRHRTRAASLDEPRREAERGAPPVAAEHPLDLLPGVPSELLLGDRDGRQRRGGVARERDVVVPRDRDVTGDGDAGLVELAEEAEGDDVVVREHRRRPGLQHRTQRGVAVLDRAAAGQHAEREFLVLTREHAQRLHPLAVRDAARRAGQVHERAVAVAHQPPHQDAYPLGVVGHQRRHPRRLRLAVDQHDGLGRGQHAAQVAGRHAGGAEDERVRAAARLDRQVRLRLGILDAVADEQPVPGGRGRAVRPAEHLLEHRVRQVGHQQGDRVGPSEREAACGAAGHVVQLGRGVTDALEGLGLDRGVGVHHP